MFYWKILKNFEANHAEEHAQRVAWRLVRSAEDRMGDGRGAEKLMWCVARMKEEAPEAAGRAEDYVRAAFVNFKTETRYVS